MQKFSFLTGVVYYQNNQTVDIYSKETFIGDVSLQISSSYADLDGKKYLISKGQNLIFSFKPRVPGFIKVTRVWGTILDYDGYLDVDFKIISVPVTNIIDQQTPVLGTTKPITTSYYDFQGWTNIEIFKNIDKSVESINFLLAEHAGASYTITSSDPTFSIVNPTVYFSSNGQQYVEITQTDIDKIGICMSVMFGGNEYELQGSNTINELEQELYLIFSSDPKIQVYKQNDSILIYTDYTDRNKLIFKSVNQSFNKIFSTIHGNKASVQVKINNYDWQYKRVEFDIVAYGLVKRPTMIVHFEMPENSEYSFDLDHDLTIDQVSKLYLKSNKRIFNKLLNFSNNVQCENSLSTQEDYDTVSWYVKPISGKIARFSVKDTYDQIFNIDQKPESLELLSTYTISNDEIILTVYLNGTINYDYDYTLSFNDRLSKQDVDYHLTTQYHTIPAGQLQKVEKITWTTGQTLRSFDIVLNGKIVPISWFDKKYYPNIIGLRDKYSKHYLNRSVNRPLLISYIDGNNNDVFTLQPNNTDWTYVPKSDVVVWQIYDGTYLIFEQMLTYVSPDQQKPTVSLSIDNQINIKSINYLTVKLDWPVNYDVEFELSCVTNTDVKISGRYKIKANQTVLKFKITPVILKSNPGFLSLQITSSNVDFDNKKISVVLS